jgi:transposase
MRREWRHLDFFQFEAWLHAEVPRVSCTACGKTTQAPVPWAREGSGFTLLFEALALTMCQGLPVRHAARMLRVRDKQLWRRIDHYVTQARRMQDMSGVRIVSVDETKLRGERSKVWGRAVSSFRSAHLASLGHRLVASFRFVGTRLQVAPMLDCCAVD